MIRKYSEAAMAGCVIAADLPLEMWNGVDAIIVLPHNSSSSQVANIINDALPDTDALSFAAQSVRIGTYTLFVHGACGPAHQKHSILPSWPTRHLSTILNGLGLPHVLCWFEYKRCDKIQNSPLVLKRSVLSWCRHKSGDIFA